MKICDNEITTGAKVRGEGKLIPKIVDMSLADMKPGTPYEVIYGDDVSVREEIENMMEHVFEKGSHIVVIGKSSDVFKLSAQIPEQ